MPGDIAKSTHFHPCFLLHMRLLNEESDHYAVARQYKIEHFETVTCLYTELCMRFEIVDEWNHL
jgi:hypothetical protein